MSAIGATLQPPSTRVQTRTARVPYGWPLYLAFGLFPVWYLLGFGALIWFFLAIPMTFSLVARSKVRVPKGFGLYLLFFIWMMATIVQLQGSEIGRIFAFLYRAGLYYSAGVWCLYIYNAPKRLLPTRTILRVMTFMWIVVVCGGWLGIISPNMQFHTLAESLMPKGLLRNDLVYTLVHPQVAAVQNFLGYPVPRPQAPFDFTNNWGGNFALLLPFVCALWGQMRTLTRRTARAVLGGEGPDRVDDGLVLFGEHAGRQGRDVVARLHLHAPLHHDFAQIDRVRMHPVHGHA